MVKISNDKGKKVMFTRSRLSTEGNWVIEGFNVNNSRRAIVTYTSDFLVDNDLFRIKGDEEKVAQREAKMIEGYIGK